MRMICIRNSHTLGCPRPSQPEEIGMDRPSPFTPRTPRWKNWAPPSFSSSPRPGSPPCLIATPPAATPIGGRTSFAPGWTAMGSRPSTRSFRSWPPRHGAASTSAACAAPIREDEAWLLQLVGLLQRGDTGSAAAILADSPLRPPRRGSPSPGPVTWPWAWPRGICAFPSIAMPRRPSFTAWPRRPMLHAAWLSFISCLCQEVAARLRPSGVSCRPVTKQAEEPPPCSSP